MNSPRSACSSTCIACATAAFHSSTPILPSDLSLLQPIIGTVIFHTGRTAVCLALRFLAVRSHLPAGSLRLRRVQYCRSSMCCSRRSAENTFHSYDTAAARSRSPAHGRTPFSENHVNSGRLSSLQRKTRSRFLSASWERSRSPQRTSGQSPRRKTAHRLGAYPRRKLSTPFRKPRCFSALTVRSISQS